MKRRYPTYDIHTVLEDDEGRFYDCSLEVEAYCVYRPAYISGLPEDCYPDESECEIQSVKIIDAYGQSEAFLKSLIDDSAMETIEERVWEDFLT